MFYFYFFYTMSKFIRDNQLDKYSKSEDEIIRPNKKKKVKKFKELEKQKYKPVKKRLE